MKKKFIYFLFLATSLLSACKTDLDVTGDYKETMIVYGLLDQSQTKQYIKINKAFLGQGDAMVYATIKDSTQYLNSLSVKLKRLSDGTEFTLLPDNTIPKDPGLFYSPDQANAIYSFNSATAHALTTSSEYSLTIQNNETGTVVSSQTSLITGIGQYISPAPSTATVPTFTFVVPNANNFRFFIKWNSGKNAKLYQTVVRFNYIDSTATGNDTLHLDWQFPTQTTQSLAGNEAMEIDFRGQDYLQFIGNKLNGIDVPQLIARRALKTDILLTAASDDLNTYIQVNAPSTGIVQDRPQFSNIKNGLGIFSSRYNEPAFSRVLHANTLDSLACGRYTRTLKFLNATGNLIICP